MRYAATNGEYCFSPYPGVFLTWKVVEIGPHRSKKSWGPREVKASKIPPLWTAESRWEALSEIKAVAFLSRFFVVDLRQKIFESRDYGEGGEHMGAGFFWGLSPLPHDEEAWKEATEYGWLAIFETCDTGWFPPFLKVSTKETVLEVTT